MAKLLRLQQQLRDLLTPGRLRWYLAALLLPQVVLFLFWETTPGVLDRQERVRGRDFIAFYVYGDILLRGEAQRVYDREYFQQIQETFATIDGKKGRPPANPLYPPTTGLLFCALALLPYDSAVVVWWLVLAGCFAISFLLLVRWMQPVPSWRATAFLALAAFMPVASTFFNGQLAGLLLLAFVGGLELHRRGQPFLAGLAFSVLALKPQLAVGLGLWLLFRLDFRTLAGCVLGGLVQVGLTALVLGPELFVRYQESLPRLLEVAKLEEITPDHEHSLGGILRNLLGPAFADEAKLFHLIVTAFAAVLLFLVVRKRGQQGSAEQQREYAAAALFVVFAATHLHTYDAVLLLIPIALLLSFASEPEPREEVGLASLVYLAGSITFVYQWLLLSLVPFVILVVLYRLAKGPAYATVSIRPADPGVRPG